ncbi:MAG: PD-(D/E)XK nuclease family protein [Flavobacterium sp.]|nr:PD-(D/E)XK nuclease family protein [Flavobacterium sp.]
MMNTSFLDQLAQQLVHDYAANFDQLVVVLPNKRAKLFLIAALQKQLSTAVFAPKISSIEDFVQELSGLHPADSITQLFEFYDVYCQLSLKPQSFELFANWAKTLLQDFNEIDRYLLDPLHVLTYIKDIEDIKRWGVEVADKTKLLENYVDFWKQLPTYYQALKTHLLAKKMGYQGLIYREAVHHLPDFCEVISGKTYVFAGFNALNAAEEKIIQTLLLHNRARVFWDADETFLNDPMHDAGLFLRRYKATWPYYKSHPFEWITNDFAQPKTIRCIGTPKTVGQTKIAGSILEDIVTTFPDTPLNSIAVVLAEEQLLVPLLYALPNELSALNITMGYSSKNNPAQLLVALLFKMHLHAHSRGRNTYVYYYKDVLAVLTHPMIAPYADANELVHTIQQYNYTFISHQKLTQLHPQPTALFELLFNQWEDAAMPVLERLSALLLLLKTKLSTQKEDEKLQQTFVYSLYKMLNKLSNYFTQYTAVHSLSTLHSVYKQVIDLAEVSFEGEPLQGLQIMGVLESRVLDFETVIILSVNEGKFPAGKSNNSFIPYDVKRELGLPTFKEKDAIYAYHFYHILQRAKQVFLLYNTESDGLDAGEMSRFITQMEVERPDSHVFTKAIHNPIVPNTVSALQVIPKSESVMQRIHELANSGFSPSSLSSYIRNPLLFYFQRILRIRETDEVEETIALNTLGTIIHESLFELYTPFVGKVLTEQQLTSCFTQIEFVVTKHFKAVYKEGEIKKGRNLLAFEVAKRNVHNFLTYELAQLKKGDVVQILALETKLSRTLSHPALPVDVIISGNVDRIEQRNGVVRIIDYKTGKVEKSSLVLKTWQGLTEDIANDKIIQVLAYAFMYAANFNEPRMEAGIISFKNLKEGFMPFTIKADKVSTCFIHQEQLDEYKEQLVLLLVELFDATIPFTEKQP